jgi:hypothetical protein
VRYQQLCQAIGSVARLQRGSGILAAEACFISQLDGFLKVRTVAQTGFAIEVE